MNQNREKICRRMEQILREYNVNFVTKEENNLLKITLCEPYNGKIYVGSHTVEIYVNLMPNEGFITMISVARNEFRLVPDWSFERMVFLKEEDTLEDKIAKAIDHVLIDNKKNTRVKHVDYTDLEITVFLTRNKN